MRMTLTAFRRSFDGPAAKYAIAVASVVCVFIVRLALLPLTGARAPFPLFFAVHFLEPATRGQELLQLALFFVDCSIVLYVSYMMDRARTDAERLAQEVSDSAERYREPIELAPEAFFLANLDYQFVLVNDAACKMVGRDRDELLAMKIHDLIPPEDVPRLEAQKAMLLVPGFSNLTEWRLRRKDGSYITVEIVANIVGDRWQAFARDITERRRAEDQRTVFQSLIESSSDFIALADPQGRSTYLNPAGRRMIGLSADYPIEQTQIADYYAPEQRELAETVILKGVQEQGRWTGETYFRNWQTGEPIPVSDAHFTISDATRTRVLGIGTVTRDISDARELAREREQLLAREQEARRALEIAYALRRGSEERLRLAIDEAPIGMALVAQDGRFLQVNRALCEIVDLTADELVQLRFQDITHPDDIEHDEHQARRLARGEIRGYRLEKRYVRRDGSSVTVDLSVSLLRGDEGEPPMFIAQMQDITERKRSDAALRLLAQAGATLTASLDLEDIITRVTELIVREVADWCLVEVSTDHTTFVRIAGANEPRASLARELEQPTAYSILRGPMIEDAWRTGQPVLLERLTPDDLPKYARSPEHLELLRRIAPRSMVVAPLTSRGQRLGVMIWILSRRDRHYDQRDLGLAMTLAGRVSLAVENTRLYKSTIEANQLRDQVLGVVAHDLRNPLSLIRLQVEALERQPGEPERRSTRPQQVILRAADRMNRLIQDLLDVAQLEAGQLGLERIPMSATTFLSETVDSLRTLAQSTSLVLDVDRDLPDICGDHDRLCQVLENLIGNAIKFTPAGGRITVSARARDRDVLYSVADTGRGIAPENLPHVFDRFWQAKKGAHGAGLGLPIARGIVEALGGQIWAESTPGRGTTFLFTVPIARRGEARDHGRHDAHPSR